MTYLKIGSSRHAKVIVRRNEGTFTQDEPAPPGTLYLFPSLTTFPSPTTYPGPGTN